MEDFRDSVKERIKELLIEMSRVESKSPEFKAMSEELKTLSAIYKTEVESDGVELEWDKFTYQKGIDLVRHEEEKKDKWWEKAFTIAKLVGGMALVIFSLLWEVHNTITGKVSWEVLRNAIRGEYF